MIKKCGVNSTGNAPNTPQIIWPICPNRPIIWHIFEKNPLHTSMVIHYSHQQKPLYLEYGIIAKQIDSTKPMFSPKYFLSHQRIGSIKRKS